jgi:alanine dehydrogenase
MEQGGRGMLLGGVPGVPAAKVVIIGGGVVGANAARMAMGLEAHVTIIDKSLPRLAELDQQFGAMLNTIYSTVDAIEEAVLAADLVVGAVLLPGAAAPKLISEALVKKMKKGSVLVDVAIDQGGCAETSKATTHAQPTYRVHDVVHYCVANMPGAVARTDKGYAKACKDNPHLLAGLNIHRGALTYEAVAQFQKREYTPPEKALARG